MYKYYLIKRSCCIDSIVSIYGFNSIEKIKQEIVRSFNSGLYAEIATKEMILNVDKLNPARKFAKLLRIL